MSQDRAILLGAAVIAAAILIGSVLNGGNGRYAITPSLARLDTRTGEVVVCRESGPFRARVIRCGEELERAAAQQSPAQARPQTPAQTDTAPAAPATPPDTAKVP